MSPIFKCLICRRDIERSTKTFWTRKGHLLCSTCLDNIDNNLKKKKYLIKSQKVKNPQMGKFEKGIKNLAYVRHNMIKRC